MKERVRTAHHRADGALVVALSFVILGVAPLVGLNLFAETLTKVFAPGPQAALSVEAPVEIAGARLAAESQCLAEAMYYEARGEGVDGQKAVAEVVLQRTRNQNYGNTVCSVVYEGIEPGRLDCQFSFACDGSRDRPKEETIWQDTKLMAEKIMTGQMKLAGQTGQAVSYHSIDVTPFWSASMHKTAQIGNHIFYRFAPRNAPAATNAATTVSTPPPPQNVRSNVQNISTEGAEPVRTTLPKL
jgi:hypothetical protein